MYNILSVLTHIGAVATAESDLAGSKCFVIPGFVIDTAESDLAYSIRSVTPRVVIDTAESLATLHDEAMFEPLPVSKRNNQE
jgi:hypothetical protein